MRLARYIFTLLIFFSTMHYMAVQAQSRVVLNAAGGTATTDDILVIISPIGKFNVFYKGFRQNFGHTELPVPVPLTYSNYGSSPVIRFKFSLPGNTTGSTVLTTITPCSITAPTGDGTPSNPEKTILTGTVQSPLTNQIYYLTCTFSWGGGTVMNMDYVIRAPFSLTQSENLHLYIDEDTYAGDDDYGFSFDGTTNGEYVGGYRIKDNCYRNSNDTRKITFFYGYKVRGSFNSTYSSNYSPRVSSVNSSSTLKLTGARNGTTSCVDNGIAVHVTFPTFTTAGQSATRRIALIMSAIETGTDLNTIKTNNLNYFNNIVITDPTVPGMTSSPVSVQFESASFNELEGDNTHQALAIKVKVKAVSGTGILGTDQTVGLTVTGGSAVQNTDYSYQNAFVIPAGNYLTEKIITVNCINILGNLIIQGDRTINMTLVGDNCNDLIGLGAQSTATYKIIDDDKPTVSLSKLNDITSCGSATNVFVITMSKATASPITVTFNMTGSTAVPSDFSSMSPTNWYTTGTSSVIIPANTSSLNVSLTAKSIDAGKVINAQIASAIGNSINATIAPNPNDRVSISIVGKPTLNSSLSPVTICSEGSLNYNPSSTTSGTIYTWSRGAVSGISPNTSSGTGNINEVLTNSATTPVTVIYAIVLTANGCSNTQNVTAIVNPKPAKPTVVAGNTTFCQGGSVVLTSSVALAGSSYQWYQGAVGSETLIASATAQTYTATTSGVYTVKVKNSYGCESDFSLPTTVTVNPLPTTAIDIVPPGTASFCDGNNVTLQSRIVGATSTSYQWYWNGGAISGAQSRDLIATTAGSYTVTVTNANGCISPQSAAQLIVVKPKPTATISGSKVICDESGPVTLTIELTGASPWSVTYTDGTTPVTITNIATSSYTLSGLHPSSTKNYTVTSVSDNNGCTNTGTGSGTVYVQPCGFGVPMMIWLKANDGVDLSGGNAEKWNDQSGSGSEDTPAKRLSGSILWKTNAINFNQSVVFNGSSSNFMAGTVKSDFTGEYTAFSVIKKSTINANSSIRKGIFTTRAISPTPPTGGDPGPGLIYYNNGSTPYYAMDAKQATSTNSANTFGLPGNLQLQLPSLLSGVSYTPADLTTGSKAYLNGILNTVDFSVAANVLTTARRFEVGGRTAEVSDLASVFDGEIAEVIYFIAPFENVDMHKVNTYLGIKYGISLPHDYLASNASPVWVQLSNTGYKTDITGIAKDNGYRLEQRISKNETPTTGTVTDIVTIAHGKKFVTDQTLAKPIGADKSYFIWGHNNGDKTFGALSNNRYLFNRVWKAQKTGTGIDTLSLQFNMAGVTLTPNNGTVTLLISDNPTFSTILSSKTVNISTLPTLPTFEGVSIADGNYFTLATTTVPAVLGTASLWLKADKDLTGNPTVATWKDQTINADIYAATNNPKRYLDVTDNVNFNPLVRFSGNGGTKDYFTGTTAIQLAHTYVVGKFATTGIQALANSGAMIADKSTPGYLFRDMNVGSGIGFHDQSSNVSLYNLAAKPQGIQLFGYKSVPSGKKNTYLLNGSKQDLTTNPNTVVGAYTEIRRIGTQGNPVGGYFQGDIAEVIGFADTLDNENKRLAVESYLAIKYGIALTSNYLASDYTTVTWNQSQDVSFRTQIAGIGRDDAFGLAQQVSHNVQPGADMVTIAHGIAYPASVANAQSGTAVSVDKSFFVWANNNRPTTFLPTVTTVAGNKFYLMDRKWLVQKTGTGIGNVSMEMDTTGTRMQFPSGAGACRKLVLLSSVNSSFSAPNILGTATISATGKVIFNNLLIDNAHPYFTLAVVEVKAAITSVGSTTCDIDPNMHFPLVADLAVGETGVWTLESITGGTGIINSPNSASTYATLSVQTSSTDVVATFRWTVTNTQTACTDSKLITYTRYAKPPKPDKPAQDPAYCQKTVAVPLQATALAGYTLNWYSVAGGVMTSIGTVAPTPSTTTVETVRYAVTQKHNTTLCESDTTQIDVTTHALPEVVMMMDTPDAICLGAVKAIELKFTAGKAPWNVILSDGTQINGIMFSPHVFHVTPSVIGNTEYSVMNITDGNACSNAGTNSVTVSVNPIISIPKSDVTADTICPGADALIKINPTTSGATYSVYADELGTPIESKESTTGGLVTLNAGAIQKTTDFYLKVTSPTGCQENRLVMIEVPVRPTLANYPDIRLQICPNPNRPLNLSSFLDTTDYKSVSWTAVTSFSPPLLDAASGSLQTAGFTATGTHVYTYSIANTCYPDPKVRKVYILPMDHKQVGKQVDTVAICKDFATGINLRQILGLAAGGEWFYDVNITPFVRKASNYPFSNALILEGDKAYAALQSTAYQKPYKTDANAIHLDFIYTTTGTNSCLGAGTRRLVVVITSTIL